MPTLMNKMADKFECSGLHAFAFDQMYREPSPVLLQKLYSQSVFIQ